MYIKNEGNTKYVMYLTTKMHNSAYVAVLCRIICAAVLDDVRGVVFPKMSLV